MATPHAQHVNAEPIPKHVDHAAALAAAAGNVWVSATYAGAPVTSVSQTTSSASKLYFLNLAGGTTANSVLFEVTFKNGSPLTTQTQSFSFPSGYGGGITTPFGVPNWGGNPILGPAVLTVLVNGQSVGSYNFNVVA
jgi:hypothetical protein